MKRIPVYKVSCVRDGSSILAEDKYMPADSPARVVEILRSVIDLTDEREQLVGVYVDASNRVKGVSVLSIGTLSASLVHPREVFRPAIVLGCAGVIVAHNHPSGIVEPSSEDREATRRLSQAGKLLGIPLLDHVILSTEGYYSFRERGLMS